MGKQFAWSYSKWKNYDLCPRRHNEIDILKHYKEESEQLIWGNQVHAALASALLYNARLPASGNGKDRVAPAPLPDDMKDYQKWIDRYADPELGGELCGELYVERKYAVTKDFKPTEWFGNSVWLRGVCDLLILDSTVAVAVDWKTGKLLHDSRQLMIMAQCIFAHHPEVKRIRTEFVWLKEDCTTVETFNRDSIYQEWPPVLDVVNQMQHAAEEGNYPPKRNKLCRQWCPVTSCEYHGKGM